MVALVENSKIAGMTEYLPLWNTDKHHLIIDGFTIMHVPV